MTIAKGLFFLTKDVSSNQVQTW